MKKGIFIVMSLIILNGSVCAISPSTTKYLNVQGMEAKNNLNQINKEKLVLNGIVREIPGGLLEVSNQILFPFKWLAKEMGASKVEWDNIAKTVTVQAPTYYEEHLYLSYLNGLINEKQDKDYSLPIRVKRLQLPPYPLKSNGAYMFQQKPITFTIEDEGFSLPFVGYDYVVNKEKLYVTSDWFNTIFLANTQVDKDAIRITYPIKSEIEGKLNEIQSVLQPTTPEETLALWIRGQQVRSGALQYSALAPKLKEQVLQRKAGWVTGGSSPSAGDVTIVKKEQLSEDRLQYQLKINEMLQGKVSGEVNQTIQLGRYSIGGKDYWLIDKATGDLAYFTILPDGEAPNIAFIK